MTPNQPARFIDFHSHYYDAAWASTPMGPGLGGLARVWPMMTDITAQLDALEAAGVDAKVLSAPAASLAPPGGQLPARLIQQINDRFAELVAAHPGRLLALATIDAFQGETAALEVERAVQTLGLGGICVDCAQGDRLLDAAEARPTFAAAAALGVPVFVHPISPAGLTERYGRLGHTGVLLARGTEDAASTLALLRSGIFDELPDLNVVIPMIGVAALIFAGMADHERTREEGWQGGAPSLNRTRLYIDTMGFDAAALRFALDLLGPHHVLLGSDWPIMPIAARPKVEALLASLNLSAADQAAILSGNTLRLLGIHQPPPGAEAARLANNAP